MYATGLTAIGKVRSHNEDAYFCSTKPVGALPNLFIVADGMGGHNAGEVASAKSLEYSLEFINKYHDQPMAHVSDYQNILVTATNHANNDVYKLSILDPEYQGMGTTYTACTFINETMAVSHIGDSRIYAFSPHGITQVTKDHTMVQELVDAGTISKQEAKIHPQRNMLTRVLGCDPYTTADGFFYNINKTDSILICSDGLTDMLTDEEIFNIVMKKDTVQDRAKALVSTANENGGIDNITVIIIDL